MEFGLVCDVRVQPLSPLVPLRGTREPISDAGQLLEGDDRTAVLGSFFDDAVGNAVEHHLEPTRLFPTDRLDVLVSVARSTPLE